jgi:hypothetical protein
MNHTLDGWLSPPGRAPGESVERLLKFDSRLLFAVQGWSVADDDEDDGGGQR